MKTKLISAVAVLAVGVSLAVAAPQAAREWHRGAQRHELAQKLNLTDAQKQQLRDLHKQFRQENQAFFKSFRANIREFRAAKKAGDTAKVESLKPALKAQREQMKQLRAQFEPKMLSILTPAQQAQFKALRAEAAARHQKRTQQ